MSVHISAQCVYYIKIHCNAFHRHVVSILNLFRTQLNRTRSNLICLERFASRFPGNDLLESCPFFRNEIGGEGEREVSLTRCAQGNGVHRPSLSYGVAVLEPAPGETLWRHTCPLQKRPVPIESVDEGAHYYRRYFFGELRSILNTQLAGYLIFGRT